MTDESKPEPFIPEAIRRSPIHMHFWNALRAANPHADDPVSPEEQERLNAQCERWDREMNERLDIYALETIASRFGERPSPAF